MPYHLITTGGFRIHYSIRGPDEDATRVLVLGHTAVDKQKGWADDFAHLTLTEAREVHKFLGDFLSEIRSADDKAYPKALRTEGDRAVYEPWERQTARPTSGSGE